MSENQAGINPEETPKNGFDELVKKHGEKDSEFVNIDEVLPNEPVKTEGTAELPSAENDRGIDDDLIRELNENSAIEIGQKENNVFFAPCEDEKPISEQFIYSKKIPLFDLPEFRELPDDEKQDILEENGYEVFTKEIPDYVLKMKPTYDHILVIPERHLGEKKSKGGIALPDNVMKEKPIVFGFVIAEGPGCKGDWVGKYLWYPTWLGTKAVLDEFAKHIIWLFDEESAKPLAEIPTNKILRAKPVKI